MHTAYTILPLMTLMITTSNYIYILVKQQNAQENPSKIFSDTLSNLVEEN